MSNPLEAKFKIQLLLDDALRSLRQLRSAYKETLGQPVDTGTNAAAPAVQQAQTVAKVRKQAEKEVTQAQAAEIAARKAADRKAGDEALAEQRRQAEAVKAARKKAADEQAAADKKARADANFARQAAPQLTDIVVGLASGQNPAMVALQQGGQLKDLAGGFGNLGRQILSAFTPLRALIGGVVGAMGAVAVAAVQGYRESDTLNKTLAVTGNVAGLTAGAVEQSSKRIAAAQSASISNTREALVAGASLGVFTGKTLDSAGRAATALSKLTGKAAAEQIADFAAMADGVSEWAAKANRSYNFLTAGEYAHIRSLEAAGKEQEAMRLVLDKLATTMEQRSVGALGLLEKGWRELTNAVSDYWDALKSIGRQVPEEQVQKGTEGVLASIGRMLAPPIAMNPIAEMQRRATATEPQPSDDSAALGQQKKIKQLGQAYQDALSQLAQAGIQRRLAQQQAGFDAEQQIVERANAKGLLTEERYQVALAEIDARRAKAEVAATRALIAQEEERKKGLSKEEEVLASRAKIEQLKAQLTQQQSKASTAAAQPGLIADAHMLQDARDASQQWADAWQQAFEQTRAFSLENAQTNALRVRDPIARAQAEANAAVASLKAQVSDIRREVQKQIELAEGRAAEAAALAADTENDDERDRLSAVALTQTQQRVELQRQLNDLVKEGTEAENARINASKLASYRTQFTETTDALMLKEQQLDDQVQRGQISVEKAEQAKNAARQQAVPTLERLIELMRKLDLNPGDQVAVDTSQRQVDELKQRVDSLRESLRGAVKSGFGQLFEDVATGSKTALQAFKDFVVGIAKAALNVIGQRLGERLADSFFPKNGGGSGSVLGSIGNFFVDLFSHHTGGVIGSSGTPRALGMGAVFAAAAAGLPYYHSGGLVGLRADEELAVLQHGEEVLTADNPRHANNFRGGGTVNVNGLTITTKIEGASGAQADMQAAGDRLNRMVKGVVAEWATEESREGGILSEWKRR